MGPHTFLAVCTAPGQSVVPIDRDADGCDRTHVHGR
jgi:hypothetical protein